MKLEFIPVTLHIMKAVTRTVYTKRGGKTYESHIYVYKIDSGEMYTTLNEAYE